MKHKNRFYSIAKGISVVAFIFVSIASLAYSTGNMLYVIASSPKDIRPNHNSNSKNNKFLFAEYVGGMMDSNGEPIVGSMKKVRPQKGTRFEIEIVYYDNERHPASIYLNELDGNNDIVKTELLADLFNKYVSVKYKSNGLDIFTYNRQIHFSSDGNYIIVYYASNGSMANQPVMLFSDEDAAPAYKIRYYMLKTTLGKYYK